MKKAAIQKSKELALDVFKWQIRFLPMPKEEQEKHIKNHACALGLTKENKNNAPRN